MKRTAEEFKTQVKKLNLRFWAHHDCSICKYTVGYVFLDNGKVCYDSGCYCTYAGDGTNLTPRTWENVAEAYNAQSNPAVIERMDEFWGFEPAPTT